MSARPAARRGAAALPQQVRIIGGQWKRSRLPVADRPGLRPTPDRVRETLFNWLGQDLSGWRCLDAFAGSGALGFEAASRGAASVLLLERDPALAQSLRQTAQRLATHRAATAGPEMADAHRRRPARQPVPGTAGVQVVCTDALAWMARAAPAQFDLVFIDPPYGAALLPPALAAALPLVAAGGRLYLEGDAALPDPLPGWRLLRSLRAGAVHARLLGRDAAGVDPAGFVVREPA